MTAMSFKTIEREDPSTGEWSIVEFEALKRGDTFRITEGLGAGENPGPWICLDNAVPIPNEPENFGVHCHLKYFSAPPA